MFDMCVLFMFMCCLLLCCFSLCCYCSCLFLFSCIVLLSVSCLYVYVRFLIVCECLVVVCQVTDLRTRSVSATDLPSTHWTVVSTVQSCYVFQDFKMVVIKILKCSLSNVLLHWNYEHAVQWKDRNTAAWHVVACA